MNGIERAVWFLGDLDDPWVKSILASVSREHDVRAISCAGDLPERPFDDHQPPTVIILHRCRVSGADLARLEGWRADGRSSGARLILCFSSYVRYEELERCGRLVDVMIGEATAAETLGRHLAEFLPAADRAVGLPVGERLPIDVASGDFNLRTVLSDALGQAGFRVTRGSEPPCERPRSELNAREVVTVWDVPVLDDRWDELLRRQSRLGAVIALLGFADRPTVERARKAGASACLDMPVDLDDLVHVVDRVARGARSQGNRAEPAHLLPPVPAGRGGRGLAAIRGRIAHQEPWPDDDVEPRIK